MQLQIQKLHPDAKLPTYAHAGDAGMDLYTVETVSIAPSQRMAIPSGIAVAIPDGYAGLVWEKSGLAVNKGVATLAGVIDAGYRGEIMVAILNTSDQTVTFEPGDKIAQMLIQKVETPELVEVSELSETTRGAGGFGSTGAK